MVTLSRGKGSHRGRDIEERRKVGQESQTRAVDGCIEEEDKLTRAGRLRWGETLNGAWRFKDDSNNVGIELASLIRLVSAPH